ncbi:Fgl1, partial [Symbiodinium sp. CCMP2456]
LNGYDNSWSPVSWTFAGSNDGRDWTILDTQAGHTVWSNGEEKTFTVDPDAARNAVSTWTVFYRGRIAGPPGHFESSTEKGSQQGHFFKRLPTTASVKTLLRVSVEGGPCGARATVQFPIGNKRLLDYLREGKQSGWVPVDTSKVQILEGSIGKFCSGKIDHFWTGHGANKGWILGCQKSCARGREFASGHFGGCGKSCKGLGDFKDLSKTEVTMSFGQEPAEFCGWAPFPGRSPAHADCRHVFEHPSKEYVGGCTTAECQTLNDCHAKCSDCTSCVAVSYFEDGAQGFRCHMIGPALQRLNLVEKNPDRTTWAIHVSTRSENCKIAVQVAGQYETCLAIKIRFPEVNSGVFVLRTPDGDEFETWCDMSQQGGGWTLLAASKQNSAHQANLFRRGTYKSYTETGIGNPDLDSSGMFWAPLKIWAQYTEKYPKNRMVVLDSRYQVPDKAPGLTDMGIDAKDGFRLKGIAIKSRPLRWVAQLYPQKFTTWDRDQDEWGANCAKNHRGFMGGWWYRRCWQTSMYHSNGRLYSWNENSRHAVKYLHIFFREDASLQTTTTTTLYVATTTTTTTTTLGYVVEDLAMCQDECEEDEDCAAMSFNERTKECHMFGDIEMGYGNYIDEDDVTCYAKAPQGWFEYKLRPGKLWDERCTGGETKCDFEDAENFKRVCQDWCAEENSTRFCSIDISGRKDPCCRRSTSCEDLESAEREYRIFKHQDHYVGMPCEDGSKCLILSWKFNIIDQFPKDVAA